MYVPWRIANRSVVYSVYSQKRYRFSGVTRKGLILPGVVSGIDCLNDSRLNKGLNFTLEERYRLGIHGLLPPIHLSLDEQVAVSLAAVRSYDEPLQKYLYLARLSDVSERVFFKLLTQNVKELMPVVYTPTVGQACINFGSIFRNSRGLFVTIQDADHIYEVISNWPETSVRVICVTDGERILGLGDLGAYGMGIPIGKLQLATALAMIPPHECLPVVVDVGTNNPNLLEDPFYVGIRQTRIGPELYMNFLDEFMAACVKRFGRRILVQFEDFGSGNAFRVLQRYRDKYCCFNDDIQGTASVVLAGLLSANRVAGSTIENSKTLIVGAGQAGVGIAEVLVKYMMYKKVPEKEARDKIFVTDEKGLFTQIRTRVIEHQRPWVRHYPIIPPHDLLSIVDFVKPQMMIGVSGTGNIFTPLILKKMAEINKHPIICALSNPTQNAECTALDAYTHTEGRCVFLSGSPFEPVEVGGKTYHTAQANNAYIFPGVTLGAVVAVLKHIPEEVFFLAAQVLAGIMSEDDIKQGKIFPPFEDSHKVSIKIAEEVMIYGYKNGLALGYPEPEDKLAHIKKYVYNADQYSQVLSKMYRWKPYPCPV